MRELSSILKKLETESCIPCITAHNRVDGPGSSLDLREFQEAFWKLPPSPPPDDEQDFAQWSRRLPRTVGITINVGCQVEARPLEPGRVGIVSHDFGYEYICSAGHVPYRRELWLLKILDIFGLSGVRFELSNLIPGIKESGLGGSATAASAVALLANELCGRPFDGEQVIALASLIEQDLGVSITGTQEQSNVVYGGVTDYVWFPWGIPRRPGGYGTSIRRTLLAEESYPQLEQRMRIYHSGSERSSTDVNSVWRKRLQDPEGYEIHMGNIEIAHRFREGIRNQDWRAVAASIAEYRTARVHLCSDYMTGKCWDIQAQCERFEAESFPLGAGGGGALLIFSPYPHMLCQLDSVLAPVYRLVQFHLCARGHRFENVTRVLAEFRGGTA